MTLPVVWIPEANEDLLEARAWYDNIRPGLGERFAFTVEATESAAPPHGDGSGRRQGIAMDVPPLPQDHRIVVIACFHGRRNPRRWQSR